MSDLKVLRTDQIKTRPGFNPRTDVEVDELTASVKQHGILSPLTVRPDPDEKETFFLIAGERRYTAALFADVKEVPCLVRDETDELVVAITENIHREDLDPIEEANAIKRLREEGYSSRKQIATKLAISERRVKERELLSDLSPTLQDEVRKGLLPLKSVEAYSRLCVHAPDLAEEIHQFVKDNGYSAGEAAESFGYLVKQAGARSKTVVVIPRTLSIVTDEKTTDERREVIDAYTKALHYEPRIILGDETADQARGYGCLYEDPNGDFSLITDLEWFADHLSQLVDKALPQWRQSIEDAKSGKGADPPTDPDTGKPAESDERSKEIRKDEYRVREEAKAEALAYNDELAAQVFERLNSVDLDKDLTDLLIHLAVGNNGPEYVLRGLRYLHPAYRDTERMKNGKTKVRYLETANDARKRLHTFLDAPTIDQKLGRLCQLLLAARFADERAVARSSRAGHGPRTQQWSPDGTDQVIEAGYDRLLKKLTPRMREDALKIAEHIAQDRGYQGTADYTTAATDGSELGVSKDDES